MTYTDPQTPPPERPVERHVEVRESGSNNAGWLIAGMIAIVAVVAVGFLMMRPSGTDPNQLQQAQEQGRQAGLVEGASSATQAAQAAAENAARDARATADQVRRDGQQAAQSAAQSAQDAADRAAASRNDQAASPDNPPAQPQQ
ncbi:hypothetical protein [Caulobacter sp. 1776]|uniref:hypothetical protein n=1 Tax=Caulobacter sp. 1776 TaxID=3156420 RepID=UPI0033911AA8